jgi:hypothetical protein
MLGMFRFIFFFLILCFHFEILELQPWFGYRIYPKQSPFIGKIVHFSYYNPAVFFVKRDEIFKQTDKTVTRNIPNI